MDRAEELSERRKNEILYEIAKRNPGLEIIQHDYLGITDEMRVKFLGGRRMLPMYKNGRYLTVEEAKKDVTKLDDLKAAYGSNG